MALNHASNVVGTILPVAEVAALCRRAGTLLLVDAAQTAGALPIDMAALGIDLLAFTGHKALLGPPGTGGLVIGDTVDAASMAPLLRGGTGSRSEFEVQPEDCPDKFESGTPNGVGIAGLAVKLIPTPREFSSDCGLALRFAWADRATIKTTLASARVVIADVQPMAARA